VSGSPQPVPVLPGARFDEAALAGYLRGRLPGFDGEMQVSQFQAGQSNPTYRLDTPAGAYVLRKKPAGALLPSAHAVDREFTVIRALQGRIPVPKVHVYCDDESVLGQPFYVMELVPGRVMPDARLLEAPREERTPLSLELVTVLARLHQVDYREAGLEGFGRPEGYVARQLARWSKQYAASRVEENADMDGLIGWLEANLPGADEASIVHGDYRSHNVIFAPDAARIAAVLDWELATIGHPIADLAYCCLPYYLPPDDVRGFHGETPQALGIPEEAQMLEAYCKAAGRADVPNWRYFIVFALFRSAAIRAGIYKRALDGTAANAKAMAAGLSYRGTAAFAWRLAQTAADA
jgi:aminoglycoside phosphotransferase (APT) family kinase protein